MLTTVLHVGWPGLCAGEEAAPSPPRSSLAADALREEVLYLQEETVVTAIRQEQPISQAPSNLYVITEEDIRLSGAVDIPTLLRRVPGMEVAQTTGPDFNVSVRGDNQNRANKLLVLVDGRSIYVDMQGLAPWTQLPITLPEIKRIEVLKGPASAIYGFNAFDGVVNIITKRPDEMLGTTLQTAGGEYGTLRNAAVQAGRKDQFSYRLSVGQDQEQQWRDRNAQALLLYRFNGEAFYDLPGEARLKLAGGYTHANPYDSGAGEIANIQNNSDHAYTELLYDRPDFFLRLNWYLSDQTINYNTVPALVPFITVTDRNGRSHGIPFVGNTYNAETQYAHDFFASHHVIVGANYRLNTLSGTQVTGFTHEDRFGAYLQDEWRLLDALRLSAGARLDLHSRINPTYSPRIAAIYTPVEDHTFRASGSVAYRPPTLIENFSALRTTFSFPGVQSTDTLRGNTNLSSEQIVSYEASYQGWYAHHRLRLRLDAFYNRLSGLIGPVSVVPLVNSTYRNQGKADITGGEAGFDFLATTWLTVFANYAYQQISQADTGSLQRGGPRFKVNGGLQGKWDNGVNGEVAAHYIGSASYPVAAVYSDLAQAGLIPQSAVPNTRIGSYTLLNLRGGYRFWHDKAELAVSAFNALNDRHREMPTGDVIGSRVMAWLTLRL